jgi:hypothetical protein
MVNILPIPPNLLIWHGISKLICAVLGTILLGFLLKRYFEKKSRIAKGFVFVFICLIMGNIFTSFDNLLGWDNLLGPGTWLGYGLAQVWSTLASVGYFWIYIEVFQVKDQWTTPMKRNFLLFLIVEITTAILMMTYYLIGFPADMYLPTGINLGLTVIVYFAWIAACTKLLKTIDEPRYRTRFQYLRMVAVLFLIVIILLALASISETPSFTSWIGMGFMILGMYCGYKGILAS